MNTWMENVLLRMDAQAEKMGDPMACLELANLYREERPLSALAFGLKAKRIGDPNTEISPLEAAVERLRRSDWEKDVAGCYYLGLELGSYGDSGELKKAIGFLETVAESKDEDFAGRAAFQLAELLSSVAVKDAHYRQLAYQYYAAARKQGYYDILCFDKTVLVEEEVA
ncbi:MAG: hypothetical protein IKM73_08125 [Acidaminococcaceae bacterium]|nr:hypothetical protein [Acidaminococcaceae bacterium]